MSQPSQEPLLPVPGNINYRPPDSQHTSQLIVDDTDKQFIDFTKQANQILDASNPVQISLQAPDIPSQLSLDPDFLPPIARSPSANVATPAQPSAVPEIPPASALSSPQQLPPYDSQSQVLLSLDQAPVPFSSQPIPLVAPAGVVPAVGWDSPISQPISRPVVPATSLQPSIQQQPPYAFSHPPVPNQLRAAPGPMKPLVKPREQNRNKRQCTSTGKAMYESSELYSVNPTPSLEVLRSMRGVTLKDSDNRVYWKADEHEFGEEWVKDKMSRLTINRKTDSLWWVRADSHESKGMFMKTWPQVGTTVTLGDQQYKVLENSDGQIERKARARNTGYVILRAV